MPGAVDRLLIETLLTAGGVGYQPTSTPLSLNGLLTLSETSNCLQFLTGSGTGFSVKLPAANALQLGRHFLIANTTTELVDVKDGAGSVIFQLDQLSIAFIWLETDSSIPGKWFFFQVPASNVASGIIHYDLSSSTPFTTTSAADVAITNFSITPFGGQYAVWFNSDATCTQNNSTVVHSLYKSGVVVSDTVRRTQSVSSNFIFQQSTMGIISFNGTTDYIDVRVKTNQGSLTVNGRSLLMIRLGAP